MYVNFLDNHFARLCTQAGITRRLYRRMWFQQDGAPAHTAGASQAWLHANFANRYIGRGSILNWPPRSPDLNPLDFFLWGYVKSGVYRHSVDDVGTLRQHVTDALRDVTPEMLDSCRRNFLKRLNCCIECNGAHFEHVLS